MQYKNGSIIEVSPDDYPLIIHFGILVNYGGEWWILHNNEQNGVNREKLDSVLERSEFIKVVDTPLTGKTTDFLLQRFKQFEGKPYDLINYNCETFVNDFLKGKKVSIQVIIVVVLLFFAVIFTTAWITKKIIK